MDLKAKVECHCRLISFSISIPSSSLPLKAAICHCHSCRHTTGQLFATFAVIPLPLPSNLLGSDNLIKYAVSTCERWSCRRCGASVINIDRASDPEEWEVSTGALNFASEEGLNGKLKRVQLWVEDVRGDGVAVGWIHRGKLEGMDRHWKGRGSEMVSDKTVKELMTPQGKAVEDNNDRLVAQCKCKGVHFEIKRPGKVHNDGTGKFESCLDACNSCRTVTGFEITSWTTVPRDDVVAGRDLDVFLEDRPKLGLYHSSSNTSRYFCTTCGATVFYYRHGLGTIDIATGLFESKTDASGRVEEWLEWHKLPEAQGADKSYLLFKEDAIDAQFVNDVAEGMKAWVKEHGTRDEHFPACSLVASA